MYEYNLCIVSTAVRQACKAHVEMYGSCVLYQLYCSTVLHSKEVILIARSAASAATLAARLLLRVSLPPPPRFDSPTRDRERERERERGTERDAAAATPGEAAGLSSVRVGSG